MWPACSRRGRAAVADRSLPEIDGYELARRLEQRTLDAARLRGYRRALTICTSRITSVLAERTGFQRLSAFDYATYEIDGQRVFQPLAARHREIVLTSRIHHELLPHHKVCTRLRASKIHGIGVFAICPIKAGTMIFPGIRRI